MEGAFVVRLKSEDEPGEGELAGSVEEVDTGREIRFRSTDELVKFLRQHRSRRGAFREQTRQKEGQSK
jgi:hypothetical protein